MQLDDFLPPALAAFAEDAMRRDALLRVLSVAEAITGNRDRAAALLLGERLRIFDNQTAVDLVIQGRESDVLAYLQGVSAGAAG